MTALLYLFRWLGEGIVLSELVFFSLVLIFTFYLQSGMTVGIVINQTFFEPRMFQIIMRPHDVTNIDHSLR
jgi:hypothetical protein